MGFAMIDCYHYQKFPFIKKEYHVEELEILLPHFRKKKSICYGKKVWKLLNKAKINQVVLAYHLLQNRQFCNVLSAHQIHIITGRKIYLCILVRALKEISFQMNFGMEQWKVVLLMEEYSVDSIELIRMLAKEVKLLTVVTTNKDRLGLLTKKLYEQYGIILKVVEKDEPTSFKSSNVLINVDFSCEDMNSIVISNDALIICGFANEYQLPTHFNGVVIRKIEIKDKNNKNPNWNGMSLCEARIYHFQRSLRENDRTFEREGYKIMGFFGENGQICTNEFRKLGEKLSTKLLDK